MNIAMIGKGRMGAPLAHLAKNAGHSVTIASRDPKLPVLDAIAMSDMVFLAVPYDGAIALVDKPAISKAMKNKVVVDLTNPIGDMMTLKVGNTTSAAEEIAKRLPGAKVVKAFNTVFAEVLRNMQQGKRVRIQLPIAGDDENAKLKVMDLAKSFGFETLDVGPLALARYLEPLAALQIQLAFGKGMGSKIGYTLVQAVD